MIELGYDLLHDIRIDEARVARDDAKNEIRNPDGSRQFVTPKTRTVHSGRVALSYEHALSETSKLTAGVEFLQGLSDTGLYRINGDVALTTKIFDALAISFSFSERYESKPVPGKEKLDTVTSVSLVYTFLLPCRPAGNRCFGVSFQCMFFLLSKILDVALSPLCWAMALVALGMLAPRVAHPTLTRWMRRAPAVGLLLLYLSSIELVSNALWRWVETPPLTTLREGEVYDVAVILGGMLDDRAMRTYGKAYYNDNIDRLIAARELLVTGKVRRALLSGGDGNLKQDGIDEAVVLKEQLVAWGIEPERLIVEDRSRNTWENAVESATILRREGWTKVLLVTSSFHMPRSLGCFRAVGIEPDTLAVDLRSDRNPKGPSDLLPRTKSLHTTASALRELAGRVIYRLRGYSR